jgi:glycosyltransferase involved in cell wall biosynthesis
MRIAQVSPLYESVPPQGYGGTERIVSYLTEELVRAGHDVTLFASGDSRTRARLVPVCARSLRMDPASVDPLAHHLLMLEAVARQAHEFDVIHYHVDYLHFPLSRRLETPHLTTLHGRLDIPDLQPLYREYREVPVVSISDAQRIPLPFANWLGTVHHGIPHDLYTYHEESDGYLAFLGRVSPEKSLDASIAMAREMGLPLKIAAKVDKADEDYFNRVIAPLVDGTQVEFLGEIGDARKNDFLGRAMALLFPIDWPEPFGIVMVESLACGTPVVAYRRGSVPEVLDHGQTGCIVESFEGALDALDGLCRTSRRQCRAIFESRSTAGRMAADYVGVYRKLLGEAAPKLRVQA